MPALTQLSLLLLLLVSTPGLTQQGATMKAIMATHCGPKVPTLALENLPKPEASALLPTEVLVEVAASSVNPVDWKILGCGTKFPTRELAPLPPLGVAALAHVLTSCSAMSPAHCLALLALIECAAAAISLGYFGLFSMV